MPDTTIATVPSKELTDNIFDVLFNLGIQYDYPTRARTLVLLAKAVAASKLDKETDPDSPWRIQDGASEEQRASKVFMLEMEAQRRTLEIIRELGLICQQAEIIAGMQFSEVDGYIGPDGTYISIEDAYDSTDPDDESYDRSGRARSIRAFIMKGTRILKEYGIPERRIIRMGRVRSSLADYYAWIKRIVRMDLDHEETSEALEHLVDTALACNGPDFQKQMRIRWEETGGEDLGRGMYATANAGDTVLVAIELPKLLWSMIVQPRTSDVLDVAPVGTVMPPISPAQIERVLGLGREWNPEEQQLMRAVIMASPPRQLCLDIMEAWENEETTVKSIQRVVSLTGYQIKAAMVELCTYHRDGVNTFCRLSRVEGDEQYWALNTKQEVQIAETDSNEDNA